MISVRAALCVALALAACRNSEPAGSLTPAPPVAPGPTVVLAKDVVMSSAVIPDETLQLVTAIVPSWEATTAELRLWDRASASAAWHLVDGPWPAVIGRTGAAWGIGRHGRGPVPGHTGPLKVEGDGKSPAGAFLLQGSYGASTSSPAGSGLAYQPVDDNWRCVDDPKSARYNTIVDKRNVANDWATAEEMKRADGLYTWVVDVAHNPTRLPNGGSCIFLHVWSGADSTTVGCTAMAEPKLAALIGTLAAPKQPMFVLLPKPEYTALAREWRLPPQ